MIKQYLNVIVVEEDEGTQLFFRNIFGDLKIKTKVLFFSEVKSAANYLVDENILVPDILFMNGDISKKNSLEYIDEIKSSFEYSATTTVLYSEWLSDLEIEDLFIKGLNIFMKKPENYSNMKKVVSEIITINWQYYTSGLNKENFIMKI